MRTRTGRPHWIVLDEAHHMLPADWAHLGRALPQSLGETVLVTVHPEPDNRQNIRAQNLALFAQIADAVDEETWVFHLRRGDFSRWLRGSVKDDYLADMAEQIERRPDLHPTESHRLIRCLIEARYTLPE